MPSSVLPMQGKTALVTGATSGIGQATALGLAQKGAAVVVAGRSLARARQTVDRILQAAPEAQVTYLLADLSVQSETRHLAAEFLSQNARLDVLVNNAGAYFFRRQVSRDGIEMTWALNHLSYFLLTRLLVDRLVETARTAGEARVVNVSSNASLGGKINFADLQGSRRYLHFMAYSQSKLANVLFTFELARRLEGSGVTANALHPGLVATGFAKNNGLIFRLAMNAFALFGMRPEAGARTSIYLASSPEVQNVSGQYFVRGKPARAAASAYDAELARRLWAISEEMVGEGAVFA